MALIRAPLPNPSLHLYTLYTFYTAKLPTTNH